MEKIFLLKNNLFGSPVQGEPAAVRQTEGLVSYNNIIVTEHYNPFVSLTLNTSPYTGEAIRKIVCTTPPPHFARHLPLHR